MKKFKVLDLFAGGGGFSEGFIMAGDDRCSFEIIKSVDIDEFACETLGRNHGEDKVIKGDITNEDVKARIIREARDVDVIIGGPPCQTFSLAGPARSGSKEAREELKNDVRNTLYKDFFDIVKALEPRFVIFENVEGILSKNMEVCELTKRQEKVINLVCNELEGLGYTLELRDFPEMNYQILNAADYGVAQNRRRVIIVANNYGVPNPSPVISHGENGEPYETLANAIGNLPVVFPEINTKGFANIKNMDVVLEHLPRCAAAFADSVRNIGVSYKDRKEISSIEYGNLLEYIENSLGRFCDNAGINELGKFMKRYNELVEEFNTVSVGNSCMGMHTSRIHNFRDMVIFCMMKPSTNSAQFTNLNSEHYDELLDRLYPYDRTKHKDTYVKHSWDRPSNTILSHLEKDGLKFIHPDQPRAFTPYEAALIQSFRREYWFAGQRNAWYRQIGNAVPPLLAKSIGECVLKVMEETSN